MKVLVVYDSMFGNTERLARTIAEELGDAGVAQVLVAGDAGEPDLAGIDLLAVGGPTQGHGLSMPLKGFFERLSPEAIRGMPAVTFDTRLNWPKFLAGSGAAASAKRLEKLGAHLLVPPECFLVKGKEGPLLEGELERARKWASQVRVNAQPPKPEPVGAV
jgi:flavodoxin